MLRRALLAIVIGMGVALPALAQTANRVYRVGWLGYTAVNSADDERVVAAFRQRLRELGFVEGTNLVIEWRYAEGHNERYADFAAEFVRLRVDAVVAGSGAAARAVMAASRTMPIVTLAAADPVQSGLVASLARPGGQLTGFTNLPDELIPKRLELLKVALPAAKRVAFARCPRCLSLSGASADEIAAAHRVEADAASRLGLVWQPLDVNDAADFAGVAAALRRDRPDVLMLGATQINAALKREWLALAQELRLPTFAPYRGFDTMLSYGPEYTAVMRGVAEYLDKILRGASPAELPMQEPTRFEFVVNARTARSIGVDVSPALRARADAVID